MTNRLLETKGIQAEAFKGESSIGEYIFPSTMESIIIGQDAFKDCYCNLYMTQKLFDDLVEQGRIQNHKIDDAEVFIYDPLESQTITLKPYGLSENNKQIYIDEKNNVLYTEQTLYKNVRFLTITSALNKNMTSYSELESLNLKIIFTENDSIIGRIVAVGEEAFKDCTKLVLKRIPETIMQYQTQCFLNCSELQLTSLPGSTFGQIGNNAFKNCTKLKLKSIVSNSIDPGAFENTGLESIHVYTVGTLGDGSFMNCSSLISVTFHDIHTDFSFLGYTNGIGIGMEVFKNDSSLKSVDLLQVKKGARLSHESSTSSFVGCKSCTIYINESDALASGIANDRKFEDAMLSIVGGLILPYTLIFYDTVNYISVMFEYYDTTLKKLKLKNISRNETCSILNTNNSLPISILLESGEYSFGYTLTCIGEKTLAGKYEYLPSDIQYIEKNASLGSDTNNLKPALKTLPAEIIRIGENAFKDCVDMTLSELETLDHLEEIQESAFEGCVNLKPLIISSNSKLKIGKNAFKGCSSLNPSTITADEIQESAFENCSGMTECIINSIDSLTIQTGAFKNCSSLTSLVLSTETITIEPGAFVGASSCVIKLNPETRQKLIDQGIIVNNKIDDATVESSAVIELNSELKDVNNILYKVLGAGILAINSGTAMTTTEYVPIENASYKYNDELYSLTTIGSSAFSNNKTITKADIPSPVSSIENDAFRGCTALTSVKIPNTVNTIGNYAFSGSGLVSVTIPKEVNSLGTYLFSTCSNLSSVTIEAGSNISSIPDSCFMGCSSLNILTIPDSMQSSLQSIGSNCFSGSGIVQLNIPVNVKTIGQGCFKDCTSLTSITLPTNNNYTVIKSDLFNGCDNLTSITIPSYVEVIEPNAFRGTAISKVDIPDNVAVIESNAFAMSNLQFLTIGSYIDTIDTGCFSDCPNLLQVKFKQNDTMTLQLKENTFKNSFPMQNKINDISVITYVDVSQTMINEVKQSCFENTGLLVFVPGKITHQILPFAFKDSAVCLIDFNLHHDEPYGVIDLYDECLNAQYVHLFVDQYNFERYSNQYPYMFLKRDPLEIGSRIIDIGTGDYVLLDAYGNTYQFENDYLITYNISNDNLKLPTRLYITGDERTRELTSYQLLGIKEATINDGLLYVVPDSVTYIENNCLDFDKTTNICHSSIDISNNSQPDFLQILLSDGFTFVPNGIVCTGKIYMNSSQAEAFGVAQGDVFKDLEVEIN